MASRFWQAASSDSESGSDEDWSDSGSETSTDSDSDSSSDSGSDSSSGSSEVGALRAIVPARARRGSRGAPFPLARGSWAPLRPAAVDRDPPRISPRSS